MCVHECVCIYVWMCAFVWVYMCACIYVLKCEYVYALYLHVVWVMCSNECSWVKSSCFMYFWFCNVSLTDSASLKPIWLSGTTCNINSTNCTYTLPIGYGQSCNHSKDVVLYCYGPPTPAPPTSGTVLSPGSSGPPIPSMIPLSPGYIYGDLQSYDVCVAVSYSPCSRNNLVLYS